MELDLHLKTDSRSDSPLISHDYTLSPGIVKRPYTPSPLSNEYDYGDTSNDTTSNGGVSIPNGLSKARVKKNRKNSFTKQLAPGVTRDIVSSYSPQPFLSGTPAPKNSVTTPSRYYASPTVDEPTVPTLQPAPLGINQPPLSPSSAMASKLKQYMIDHANDPETPSSPSPLFPSPSTQMANKLKQYMIDHSDTDTGSTSSSPLFPSSSSTPTTSSSTSEYPTYPIL